MKRRSKVSDLTGPQVFPGVLWKKMKMSTQSLCLPICRSEQTCLRTIRGKNKPSDTHLAFVVSVKDYSSFPGHMTLQWSRSMKQAQLCSSKSMNHSRRNQGKCWEMLTMLNKIFPAPWFGSTTKFFNGSLTILRSKGLIAVMYILKYLDRPYG